MTRTLFVCANRRLGATGSCASAGAGELIAALRAELDRRCLDWRVAENPCMGHCAAGPNLKAAPGGPLLHQCRAQDAAAIVTQLLETWT
ncbi:MAG TPA: (2Fe-2S) ferredoxin domain-containing protein [Candidatus Omnitrophota bacterium]|nr:(2Fe-2S) ferredoxin domain-containing protein [Candidatus Omnitrophota bacterium]